MKEAAKMYYFGLMIFIALGIPKSDAYIAETTGEWRLSLLFV